MFDGLIEDLTLATMADYDRLVNRLQLESAARAAAKTNTKPASRSRYFPRFVLRRPATPAL
jgi:hypothetical protein